MKSFKKIIPIMGVFLLNPSCGQDIFVLFNSGSSGAQEQIDNKNQVEQLSTKAEEMNLNKEIATDKRLSVGSHQTILK